MENNEWNYENVLGEFMGATLEYVVFGITPNRNLAKEMKEWNYIEAYKIGIRKPAFAEQLAAEKESFEDNLRILEMPLAAKEQFITYPEDYKDLVQNIDTYIDKVKAKVETYVFLALHHIYDEQESKHLQETKIAFINTYKKVAQTILDKYAQFTQSGQTPKLRISKEYIKLPYRFKERIDKVVDEICKYNVPKKKTKLIRFLCGLNDANVLDVVKPYRKGEDGICEYGLTSMEGLIKELREHGFVKINGNDREWRASISKEFTKLYDHGKKRADDILDKDYLMGKRLFAEL